MGTLQYLLRLFLPLHTSAWLQICGSQRSAKTPLWMFAAPDAPSELSAYEGAVYNSDMLGRHRMYHAALDLQVWTTSMMQT